jgi:hypothetical protein
MNCKIISTVIVFLVANQVLYSQNRINHAGQEIFLSGMNLAWVNFANDLTNFNEEEFTRALDEISGYGGNALRWWLHVDGTASPQFTNDSVSGISAEELESLELGLDLAAERGMGLVMCLWSFDMLRSSNSSAVKNRNTLMLTDSFYMQAYINNALIPIMDSVGDHPAVICWEIFNEPEGMTPVGGWSDVDDVPIEAVQTFINRTAGAIHRNTDSALVSNGSWSFIASTDVGGNTNYYSDAQLLAAGGDTDGYLDFYMVHYYDWASSGISPFHHPADYWELDKPLVIGEFSADGPYGSVTPTEAYTYLFDNGYAGALSWTWTGHDGNGDVTDAGPAMQYLYLNYPDDIVLQYEGIEINRAPGLIRSIPDTAVAMGSNSVSYANLKDHFYDFEDSTNLIFSIFSQDSVEIAEAMIQDDSLLTFAPGSGQGVTHIAIRAADSGGKLTREDFSVSVFDPDSENKALFRKAWASSVEDGGKTPVMAIDGNPESRWSSAYNDDEWIAVQLFGEYTLQSVILQWEVARASDYEIQVSGNGIDWATIFHEENGSGELDIINFDPVTTSYIRMYANERATQWGNSLWEFEAYEEPVITKFHRPLAGNISVYPNPARNYIIVANSGDQRINSIVFLDATGAIAEEFNVNGNLSQNLDISGFPPGIYFLRLESQTTISYMQIIKH